MQTINPMKAADPSPTAVFTNTSDTLGGLFCLYYSDRHTSDG